MKQKKKHKLKVTKKIISDCCKQRNSKKKTCIRKKDSKLFKLPRKFSRKKCGIFIKNKNKGFTIRASCSPFRYCKNKKPIKIKN